jgi:hypothetical protein
MIHNILPNIIALQSVFPGIDSGKGSAAAAETGKISKEVAELKSMSLEDLLNRLAESSVNFAINLAIAIVVFYAGRFIIKKIYRVVAAIFVRRGIDRSLSTFVLSLINMVLYFILVVTVIGILGIETTSFLALFASAGVAVGMALSGTLQNFAGGVLILLLKPYKIGDYIEAQGYAGTVKEIQIFFTVITTYDNKSISIPNGGLSTGSVNNWTREAYRRVSWTVSISYGDDVNAARQAILDMFENDTRVLKPEDDSHGRLTSVLDGDGPEKTDGDTSAATGNEQPEKRSFMDRLLHRHRKTRKALAEWEEKRDAQILALVPKPNFTPRVFVDSLASSSVDLTVRAWTKTQDYWDVFYHYNEAFYNELPKFGIHFPFPQLDVHLPKQTEQSNAKTVTPEP